MTTNKITNQFSDVWTDSNIKRYHSPIPPAVPSTLPTIMVYLSVLAPSSTSLYLSKAPSMMITWHHYVHELLSYVCSHTFNLHDVSIEHLAWTIMHSHHNYYYYYYYWKITIFVQYHFLIPSQMLSGTILLSELWFSLHSSSTLLWHTLGTTEAPKIIRSNSICQYQTSNMNVIIIGSNKIHVIIQY